MATPARGLWIVPSVLDRLLDDAPHETRDPPSTLAQDLEQYKARVRRDLEAMLNTRREATEALEDYPALRHSLLTYGLPDFTAYSLQNEADRSRMREQIEEAIRQCEPRILEPSVRVDVPDQRIQQLAFRVEGLLRVDPVPTPVAFDAVLQIATQQYQIRE